VAKLELSRDLSMSPEHAWEHVSDLSSLGDWLSMHEGWRSDLPSELEVGTEIVGVAGAKGMRNRVKWTIREYDPPRLIGITGHGVGGTKYALKMTVKPTKQGCSFTMKMELGGAPLFGPIGMAAVRAVKGDIDKSIRTFETLYG
jgi:hypothetical protein